MMYLIFLFSLRSSKVVMHSGATETLSRQKARISRWACRGGKLGRRGHGFVVVYPDLLCKEISTRAAGTGENHLPWRLIYDDPEAGKMEGLEIKLAGEKSKGQHKSHGSMVVAWRRGDTQMVASTVRQDGYVPRKTMVP